MFGEPVQTSPTIGVKMRNRSFRGVLLAARASGIIKWNHRSGRFDAAIDFRRSGNKSVSGETYARSSHGRRQLKNVGKAQDARKSAFRFRAATKVRIGDPGMEISAYSVVTIIVLLSPESGEEASASQLLVDSLLRFSGLVF